MALVKDDFPNGQSFTYDPKTHVVVIDPSNPDRFILIRIIDKPGFSEPK